jgi:hypothetical protein
VINYSDGKRGRLEDFSDGLNGGCNCLQSRGRLVNRVPSGAGEDLPCGRSSAVLLRRAIGIRDKSVLHGEAGEDQKGIEKKPMVVDGKVGEIED